MKNSAIVPRASLVGVGIVVLVLAMPAKAAPAPHMSDCCPREQGLRASAQTQYPYTSLGNPMDLQGLQSTDGNAEEGTLTQRPRQVDSEVGAHRHEVLHVPTSATGHRANSNLVAQGALMVAALAVLSIAVRFILLPADRIPRIGSADGGEH